MSKYLNEMRFSAAGRTGFGREVRLFPCQQGMGWAYGQAASGGNDIKIASGLPPVFSPKTVPRS